MEELWFLALIGCFAGRKMTIFQQRFLTSMTNLIKIFCFPYYQLSILPEILRLDHRVVVYIGQHIRYADFSSWYGHLTYRHKVLVERLLSQDYHL